MRQIVGLPLADGHQRLIRLVQRGDLDVAQTIRHAACHIQTIRRGGQEPCGAIALGAKHLQLYAADSADFAVLVYGAGAGDGLAAALVGGVSCR